MLKSFHINFFDWLNTILGKAAEAEDLPDLSCQDVADAALRIQKVYRGFQTRKQIQPLLGEKKVVISTVSQQEFKPEDLPDLSCAEVAKAAIQIQKVYRGFQTRKQIKLSNEAISKDDDLPDLKSKDVADAALKIQAVYR